MFAWICVCYGWVICGKSAFYIHFRFVVFVLIDFLNKGTVDCVHVCVFVLL